MNRQYDVRIAAQLEIAPRQVSAVISLLDEGNTLPFIARYRKEMTGSLDELQLRLLSTELTRLRKLDERKDTILEAIQQQEKLTPQLQQRIEAVDSLAELEDIYLPFKQKRKTRASMAIEKGLSELATLILAQDRRHQALALYIEPFLSADVPTHEDALAGACDIVAEVISDNADIRQAVRERALNTATLSTSKIKTAEDERGVYEVYYEFSTRIGNLRPHQVLAINRAETEKVLRVKLDLPEHAWLTPIQAHFRADRRSVLADALEHAILDSAKRLILPAIERDIRNRLTEQAEMHAIGVFADNLRGLISQPPLKDRVVLGIDPGYRTGCKVAVVDTTGKVLATSTIYPHAPVNKQQEAYRELGLLVTRHKVTLIAIGNGTASRETEQLAASLTQKMQGLHYMIVNEAGASVYSASDLAREELPDLDVTLRGAVSIARRAQDPLAELVKIDPRSIGVGLYQHDVNQKALAEAAQATVESVVNQVGVELNTASPALLAYVAGIGAKLAAQIVAYRNENGSFKNRKALKKVSGLGPKAFQQCAGFLRVRDGDEPLDASAIHPESYTAAKQLMKMIGVRANMSAKDRENAVNGFRGQQDIKQVAATLEVGVPTLLDMFDQLMRPGRDPREDLSAPILRSDVLTMDDLHVGMILKGTVRNMVDFGAFVDIGVKQDGLLHISQIPRGQSLQVGEVIEVKVRQIEKERGRISLAWGQEK